MPCGTFAKGLLTTLMRAPSLAEPVISRPFVVEKLGVKGAPLEKPVMPDSVQLSVMAPSTLRMQHLARLWAGRRSS